MNEKPEMAWDVYGRLETSEDSYNLLHIIANDCYRVTDYLYQTENYYFSAKAFDALEQMDPSPEYWEGKRGACVGLFKLFMEDHNLQDEFRDVLGFLQSSSNPQVESILKVMTSYARDNRIPI